ncbi:MAG: hypothetical protein AAFU69_05195, partial [Pseudomonadota bacterium]
MDNFDIAVARIHYVNFGPEIGKPLRYFLNGFLGTARIGDEQQKAFPGSSSSAINVPEVLLLIRISTPAFRC